MRSRVSRDGDGTGDGTDGSRTSQTRTTSAPEQVGVGAAETRAAVTAVRRRPGRPLSPPVRERLEARFDADLDDVRVHTGSATAIAARQIGATAYTVGTNVVLAGERPETRGGRRLLAHETAHVVQTGGVAPTPAGRRIAAPGTRAERAATRLSGGAAVAPGSAPPGVYRQEDEALSILLRQIRAVPESESPEAVAELTVAAVEQAGVDVEDDATVLAITEAVRESAPAALPMVLHGLQSLRRRREQAMARQRAAIESMQVQRRGPYGTHGPGVMLPAVTAYGSAAFDQLLEAMEPAFDNAGVFLRAMVEALSGAVDEEVARRIAVRLLGASVLNVTFPPVFLTGAAVGIATEVYELGEMIVNLFQNYQEIVDAVTEVVELLFSPAGEPLAREFGRATGTQMANQIVSLSRADVFTFTYELGRLLGPTVVEIVLGFLVPGLTVATVFRRSLRVFRQLIDLLPSVARLARRIRRSTPELPSGTPDAPTSTPDAPTSPPQSSVPETSTPETSVQQSTPETPVRTPETPVRQSTPETQTRASGTDAPSSIPSTQGIHELGREAYIAHLKRSQPAIDPDRPGLYTRNGDELVVRDDGAVMYANAGGDPTPCYRCDPIYVQRGGSGSWRRRPESEIPPNRRRGTPAPATANPATPAQVARIQRLAPRWLRESRYYDGLGETLDTVDAEELVIPALERFRGVEGFRTVLLNLLSGGSGRQGAQFVLRYALRHGDVPDDVVFEAGRRISIFDPEAPGGSRWTELGREVDVTLTGPGVRVELKSWSPDWIKRKLIDDPEYLHRQLAFDLAESQDPREVRWVFDAARLAENPRRTRQVLDIDEGTALTPATLQRAIADRLRASLDPELDPTTNTGLLSEMMRITGGGILDDIVRVE